MGLWEGVTFNEELSQKFSPGGMELGVEGTSMLREDLRKLSDDTLQGILLSMTT